MLVGPRGHVHTTLDEAVEGYAVAATVDLDDIRRRARRIKACRPASRRRIERWCGSIEYSDLR